MEMMYFKPGHWEAIWRRVGMCWGGGVSYHIKCSKTIGVSKSTYVQSSNNGGELSVVDDVNGGVGT